MSLGGIAIAIGAMVDAAVVMIENAHKKIEAWQHAHPRQELAGRSALAGHHRRRGRGRAGAVLLAADHHAVASCRCSRCEAQEGRLFGPLAFTKTYAMAAAAGSSVTLVPVLMGYWIRGRIPDEQRNPLTRALIAVYRPLLECGAALAQGHRWSLAVAAAGHHRPGRSAGWAASSCRRSTRATCSTCPSALPGLSAQKAGELLQQHQPHDQDRARGGARLRQGRPRRDRHRPGAAGDVRDHDPAQAARAVAPGHDAREAGRGARPRGEGAGPGQHLGPADPQPHRHAGHRHQEPDRRQGQRAPTWRRSTASRPQVEQVAKTRARRVVGAGRAADRRALRRRRHRPRRGRRATA